MTTSISPPAATSTQTGREVVFVDSRVKDVDSLLQGYGPGVQVVYIDAQQDGLAQMAAALGEAGDVAAVHLLAHGSAGQLWLGNTFLDNDTLAAYSDILAAIGRGLTADGDLLVYACNLAEGEVGAQFVSSLAALTGADIAASNDRTGAGGDWDLEITTGSIDIANMLSVQDMSAYQWGLATFTVTSNSSTGAGTLRAALSAAQNGDIVTFSSGMTVALDSQLVVNRNITIDGDLDNNGVADVTLDGQNRTSVIKVDSGITTTLDGLIITRGLASTSGANSGSATAAADAVGGGIHNAGNLTLSNVTITANSAAGGGGGGGVLSPTVGGGGGGGGGIGGQNGATGGSAGTYVPTAPSANTGGNGAGFNTVYMGGRGGNASGGGAGSIGTAGYTNGGAGGSASSGGRTIGGGGGGSGFDATGGKGGSAVGGIYNAATGTLAIIGTSTISDNIGAGGGGGGGGTIGGNGGRGIGAIWNKGTLNITSSNNAAMASNVGASGASGQATSGGTNGTSPTAVNNIFNDVGSQQNIAYSADVTAPTISSIVIANPSLSSGSTSTVTFTFSEPVFGLDIAEITVPNGTLTNLVTTNNITWTATLTAASDISDATNAITLVGSAVQDSAGNIGTGTATSNNYTVTDTVPPTVTVVVADTALAAGETSLVTITFSEVVVGFTNDDLHVANGTLSTVVSSDGGRTWTATLTPTANLTSTVNVISLNRTGVQDLSANSGVGIATSNNYAIDTSRPTATIVVSDSSLSIGETSAVTITFSEAVTDFTNADLTVFNGTLSTLTTSNNIVWTGTFTPSASITDTTNVITLDNTGVTDAAGNTGTGTTDSNNYAIDTQRPTATIVLADPTLTAGETSLVTITFSEAVSGFTLADLSFIHGSMSGLSSSDGGITWTATFAPNGGINDISNIITLANSGIADLAGNAGTGTTNSGNFTINTVAPTAVIVVADNSLTIGETSLVTITFSEAVTGFDNSDLTITNGTLTAVSSSDSGITWTATFTPTSNITDATNLITLDNSGVQAAASGNAGSGTTNSNNYSIDTQRPTATIVVADTALGVGQTSQVTLTFSEAVTGFTNADLIIANGTLSAVSSSDGGITWTATFTPAAGISDTTNVITLDNTGITDLAGNAGNGTTDSNNYAVDAQRPTATIVMSDSSLTVGETALVTITFSEAVTGFDNSDLSVANGTLSNVLSSDGGITWTATFTPNIGVADLTNLIVLNNTGITDLAGNTGTGTTSSPNYQVQTVVPTATIIVADPTLKIGDTSLVTVTFSEAVTGFDNSDLTIANGTLSTVTSTDGGITWTATLTPTSNIADVTNLITLDNSGVQAAASGNTGSGTTDSNNYSIDTQRPTATITVAKDLLGIGQTSTVTITFSEVVTGFSLSDLSVDNATLSNLASNDGGVTWTATLTPIAAITNASNLITLNNTGVQDEAGNTGSGTTNSNNYAIDGERPVFSTAEVNGKQLVLTYTDSSALDATNLPNASTFSVLAGSSPNSVTAVSINATSKTVTLTLASAVAAGQTVTVAYTDPTPGDDNYAIQDAAGNDAVSFVATPVTNLTQSSAPSPSPSVIDGVTVQSQAVTLPGGGTGTQLVIPVVTPSRSDNTGSPTMADIPLVVAGGQTLLMAHVPTGFGLTAVGGTIAPAGNSLEALLAAIMATSPSGSQADQNLLTQNGTLFLNSLAASGSLLVQTITPNVGGGTAPTPALGITGTSSTTQHTALVIDASSLPDGTVLQLNDVDFAAIVGAINVFGGAGQNTVVGDGARQWMVLGAEDDVLHGGGGNDTVGSLGGNDQVFGDAGDDIVFGGTGNDILSGGTGNDKLDGGVGWDTALQSGALADYTLSQDGSALVLTNKSSGEVDRLKSVELVKFDTGASLYIASSDAQAAIAHIATKWLGRDLTAEEGAEFQAYSHLTALEVAQAVLRGPFGEQLQGHTAEELIAGWQDNPQILRMDVASEAVHGSAALDAISVGIKLTDAHLQWVSDGVWEGTSRIDGDMAELHSIERVHFTDASVALDGANLAALIAVTLGEASLQDRSITSEGLALMDSGWGNQAIGAAALQLAMGAGTHTAQDTVQWLWTKAHGSAGTAEELQPYVQQLGAGTLSVGDLAWEAAQYALGNPQVALAGVMQQGLVYDAVAA